MKPLVALLVGSLLLALLEGQSPSPPLPRPPDGAYTYQLLQGGKQIGTSQIVVRTQADGTAFEVIENAFIGSLSVTTRTTIDRLTLHEHSYAGSSPQQGSFSGVIDETGLQFHSSNGDDALKAIAGTNRTIISDGLASSVFIFPALANAAGGQAITDAAINGVQANALTSKPIDGAPPDGVPAGSVGLRAVAGGSTIDYWYEPTTFLVNSVHVANVEFRLTGRAAAPADVATPQPVAAVATPIPLGPAKYTSREVTFRSADGTVLAGTLTVPTTSHGKRPAIILIHGSGPIDRDETIGPNKVFLQIAHALSNHGYVVLRYDKRGVGKSGGAPYGQNGRGLLVADAKAGVALLRSLPEVDRTRVFVLGHSEGTIIAPTLAIDDPSIRGLVLMGMPALPLDQVLVEQLTRDLTGDALAKKRSQAIAMNQAIKDGTSKSPEAPWLRSEFAVDPTKLISKVPVPMLVLQGGKDVQVYPKHLPLLIAAARATHRDITVREFPNDGHLMMQMPAGAASLDEYQTAANFDPDVMQTILMFLDRLTRSAPR